MANLTETYPSLSPNQSEPQKSGMEQFEAQFATQREEDFAKRDRLVNRLTHAENSKDVAAVKELLIDYENPHFGESIDRFTFSGLKRTALEGQRAYEKGSVELSGTEAQAFADILMSEFNAAATAAKTPQVIGVTKEGKVSINEKEGVDLDLSVTYGLRKESVISGDGLIASNGDLVQGEVRVSGYALSIRKEKGGEKPSTVIEREAELNQQTLDRIGPLRTVEKTEMVPVIKEVVNFGTQKERLALAKAHEALHQQLITGEELQNQTIAFDRNRASLEVMVEQFYKYQIYFTNKQIKWFFNAADISKITPEKAENHELGDKRDKAMRLFYLIGMSETRGKLEKHLNETQNLEEILDYVPDKDRNVDATTINRVLKIAKEKHDQLKEEQIKRNTKDPTVKVEGIKMPEFDEELTELLKMGVFEKFKLAVKFLIGPDVTITQQDGDKQIRYKLDGWLTDEERDPYPIIQGHALAESKDDSKEFRYQKKLAMFGSGSVNRSDNIEFDLKGEKGKRGYLTEKGNPYSEMSRDNLYLLTERMNLIVDDEGDEGDKGAVTDAGRFFWIRGMRDELALELYTAEKNFPKGEKLHDMVNNLSDEERAFYFKDYQKLLVLEGEPVASDLSKTIHTEWWRFKEIIRDRSAGPPLTYDKLDYTMLSELRLCRTDLSENEDVPKEIRGETRSLEEQWLGFKSPDGSRPNEKAKDLGDLDWEKVKVPDKVKSAVELSGEGITDNADNYYWIMGFLSAEDGSPASKDKRLYQYWMKPIDDPHKLQRPEFYTDKIKFWTITRHDAVAINGEWRNFYSDRQKEYSGEGNDEKEKRRDRIAYANFRAKKKAEEDINKGKKNWYEGERSGIGYSTWLSTLVKFYNFQSHKEENMNIRQAVEGTAKGDGFVVKYGFMDASQKSKEPEHFVVLPRG